MAVVSRIGAVAIDAPDPAALADFYSKLAGWEIAFQNERFVAMKAAGVWFTIQRVDEYTPPTWPDGAVPKQMHLDLATDNDLDEAEAQAVALGATKPGDQPNPGAWRVLLDPAGHPFCLTPGSAFPAL